MPKMKSATIGTLAPASRSDKFRVTAARIVRTKRIGEISTINLYTGPSGIEGFQFATNQLGVLKNGVVGFTNLTTGSTGAIQTAIGQDSSYDADVLYVGNGTQGDHSATVRFATLQADTQITVDGATAEGAGTINALTGYYADNMQGLTCSGTPTSSFATVGGIVIHC